MIIPADNDLLKKIEKLQEENRKLIGKIEFLERSKESQRISDEEECKKEKPFHLPLEVIIADLLKRIDKLKEENQNLGRSSFEKTISKLNCENNRLYLELAERRSSFEKTIFYLNTEISSLSSEIAHLYLELAVKDNPKLLQRDLNVPQQLSTQTKDFDKLVDLYYPKTIIFLVFLTFVCYLAWFFSLIIFILL